MIIHVIKEGETINSIAESYGISVERLMLENEIENPNRLAIGEAIVILFPDIIYTIVQGDTLVDIADKFGVTVMQLLRNNPYLSNREFIYPGETIVISYKDSKISELSANGYAYPFIDMGTLKKTLPFLTYLTVYSHDVTKDGKINNIDDGEIIQTAKAYGVAPIMMLTASADNQEEEINVIHSILNDKNIQARFFNNLITLLKEKGYYGVSINTPFISPGDRSLYDDFVISFATKVSEAGFKVFDIFFIRVFEFLTGTIFSGLNYPLLGEVVDGFTLISYEFGYSMGVPPGTLSIDTFRRFLNYTIKLLPPEKIQIGIQVIGYLWELPYNPGISKGRAISYEAAIQLAINNNSEILFDETTNSAYIEFISGNEYVVRFWDARSINKFVEFIPEYGLDGLGIWNIMAFFPQMWLVINAQYEIRKIIL